MKGVKPTFEDIKSYLIPKCEEYYSDLHNTAFAKDEQFYELDFASLLNIPDQFRNEVIVLPTARDMIDAFVDHIDVSNARIAVNKKGVFKTSNAEAETMRKFYHGANYMVNLNPDIIPARVGAKHYALHGLAVFKTIWNADLWPDKPLRKEGQSEDDYQAKLVKWTEEAEDVFPLSVQAINPRNIMADPSYGPRGFVIERRKILVFNAYKKWPHWKNVNGFDVGEEVTYDSYQDDTYRCDMVDGQPILKIKGGVGKHGYGFIPYVFIDSGLGNQSFESKPEMRYVGMLRYMFDPLIAESKVFSIADVILGREAWGGGYRTGPNAEGVGRIEKKFGEYPFVPEGVEFKEWGRDLPPAMLNEHMARAADYIAAHAAPRSVRGLSESGVRSGADRRAIINEASTRYQYSKDAFRHGWARVLINLAKIYKNVVPANTRMWAMTPADEDIDEIIDRDKMKEPFTCYVEFSPISEEDEYRRHDDLERMLETGLITKPWARRQMSNVDPKALELEEEIEKLNNDPILQGLVSQAAAGKLNERLMALGMQPVQPPQQGMPPGASPGGAGRPMVPGIPNIAPLGSAQDLQTKLKGMRSPNKIHPMQGLGGGGNR